MGMQCCLPVIVEPIYLAEQNFKTENYLTKANFNCFLNKRFVLRAILNDSIW